MYSPVKVVFLFICGYSIICCGEQSSKRHIFPPEMDEYLGIIGISHPNPEGFFRVGEFHNRSILVTPLGSGFFLKGVGGIEFEGETCEGLDFSPYALSNMAFFGADEQGKQAYYEHAKRASLEIGFNTLLISPEDRIYIKTGADQIPYIIRLDVIKNIVTKSCPIVNIYGFPDVFHPSFEKMTKEYLSEVILPEIVTDKALIGYLSDITLSCDSLADDYIGLSASAPGKQAFVDFIFKELKYTTSSLSDAWGMAFKSEKDILSMKSLPESPSYPMRKKDKLAFIAYVLRHYFEIVTSGIKNIDDNHLIICGQIGGTPFQGIFDGFASCEIVMIDFKNTKDIDQWIGFNDRRLPMILGGICAGAEDSGIKTSFCPLVKTQSERVQIYKEMIENIFTNNRGEILGVVWDRWADGLEKCDGFAGSGNSGLFGLDGSKYHTFVFSMKVANEIILSSFLGVDRKQLSTPTRLESSVSDKITLSWDKVEGAKTYEVILAPTLSMKGVVARKDWGGAKTNGPYDFIMQTNETNIVITEPLWSGEWFWSVSARNDDIFFPSDFSHVKSFYIPPRCTNDLDGKEEVSCFEIPETDGSLGYADVRMMFIETTDSWVPYIVFVINQLDAEKHGELKVIRRFPKPVTGSLAGDRFCPAPVYTTDGILTTSASFIRVKHIDNKGEVVLDRALDPNNSVEPFACAGPLPSTGERIALKEYYVDLKANGLPFGQRLEIQIH